MKPGKATITVRIKGTSIKKKYKITVKKASKKSKTSTDSAVKAPIWSSYFNPILIKFKIKFLLKLVFQNLQVVFYRLNLPFQRPVLRTGDLPVVRLKKEAQGGSARRPPFHIMPPFFI